MGLYHEVERFEDKAYHRMKWQEHDKKATIAAYVFAVSAFISPVAGLLIFPELGRQVYLKEKHLNRLMAE